MFLFSWVATPVSDLKIKEKPVNFHHQSDLNGLLKGRKKEIPKTIGKANEVLCRL